MTGIKRVLFVATIDQHIIRFHLPYLKWFKEQGFEVHVASKGEFQIAFCDKKFNLPIERSPFSTKNLRAVKALKEIIDVNKYSIVHCHTPMGSVVTRLAARGSRKSGTKVLYTAHGFHFFKGAPLKNWLLYYPIEKLLAKYTDAIITINTEDFELLKSRKFKSKEFFRINGIGVDNSKFKRISEEEKITLRKSKGYNEDDFILIYPAEFIHRKNHKFILDSVVQISSKIPQLKIIFAGRGELLEEMKKYTKDINLGKFVDILGFRTDITELIQLSDIGISSSKHEGLPINLVEEMFCGLPLVAAKERGNKDLIENGVNGFLFAQNNHTQFADYIVKLYKNKVMRIDFGEHAFQKAQKFSLENSLKSMADIYKQFV
ncbi:MAG: hypothetical protein FD170_3587 [Bacteroidetes bacterium]|nr:MAG: hypothetical protein FD170_3587 [Bacteroidota bacterium]